MTSRQLVYVGTYTDEGTQHRTEGVYIYEFDAETGKFRFLNAAAVGENPSYLAFSHDKRYLFAVNEGEQFAGVAGGGISAFELDRASGQLKFINAQPTHGVHPCYVSVDGKDQYVLVANYTSGNVTVLPIGEGGQLGTHTALVQNQGHSVHPIRQASAHAHCVVFHPNGQHIFVADLGIDQILVFKLSDAGQLIAQQPPSATTTAGAGPRHIVFHPNGRYAYVSTELDSTVTVYAFDEGSGMLQQTQTISSLPGDFTGESTGADIHISADGGFVYASNRGHDSIAVFTVEQSSGQLSLVEVVSCGGKKPRNFALDLSGGYLIVANQDSDTLVIYRVDAATGRLTATGEVVSVPSPVCVKFIE